VKDHGTRIERLAVPVVALVACLMGAAGAVHGQELSGDFRFRFYNDRYVNTMDNRGTEDYIRYLARIRMKWNASAHASFFNELTTFTEANPLTPVRGIAGTGPVRYGISQVFAQLAYPNVLCFDALRFRVGRQQFPVGKGLSMGESYYFTDKFDGARLDLSCRSYNLSLFGAITGANVSESGLYPEPGTDQLYVARLSKRLFRHDLMLYSIYEKPRNDFNDDHIVGAGFTADWLDGKLDYYAEGALQKFHTLEGLPEKGGVGCMAGVGYRWSMKYLRSIKVETQFAAYQGDNAYTPQTEIFSPLYPSFFWGDRNGYVNGAVGGDYPYDGRNAEGSKIWYSRCYFRPAVLPDLRLQFQYISVSEYVNVDNYNVYDDEFAVKAYYDLSKETTLQFRYAVDFSNGEDRDLNGNGIITSSEDRVNRHRFMVELSVEL
jgi:hypothetical protein